MAGLLALRVPAGRAGARLRLRPRATWLLGAAAPCSPPPLALTLLRPGPDARLLRTAGGDCRDRQDPSRGRQTGSHASSMDKVQSKSQQLKQLFREYGTVGMSLHIGISLVSLGIIYMAVSSGTDISGILVKLGFTESLVRSKMAAGTSTFLVAYAIHKLFAPVRISITLISMPLLIRYLRRVGLLKPPASKP